MGLQLNSVSLAGNLTSNPEAKELPSGAVCNFGIAINRKWKDKAGTQQEDVTFVDCTAWGKTAEFVAKYLVKGRGVYVEGRLQLEQWEDKTGGKRSKLKVVADRVQFTDAPPSGADADPFA